MGSQQIILIVLCVVIVGIAVAVGIFILNSTSINTSRHAIISDMENFGAMVVTYYKTPVSLGGSGYGKVNWDEKHIKNILGFKDDENIETENAIYTIQVHTEGNSDPNANSTITDNIIFYSIPKEGALNSPKKRPKLEVELQTNSKFGTFKLDYY